MAILAQFGLKSGNFDQGAASFRNYAGQMRYQHPWGAKSNALAILLLPSFERGFFDMDRVPSLDDVMSELAMQTLAVGGQSSFCIGVLSPGRLVSLAFLPVQARFACFFDTSLLIVVLRIGGPTLAVHLALQATLFPGVGCQFLAKRDQIGFARTSDNGKRLRANIQADDVLTHFFMLGFDESMTF